MRKNFTTWVKLHHFTKCFWKKNQRGTSMETVNELKTTHIITFIFSHFLGSPQHNGFLCFKNN